MQADYSPLAVRGSHGATNIVLKSRRRVSYPPRLYVASAFAAVCIDSKAGVLSNNASVYCLRTAAIVSCRYVSCSVVWTGVVPLSGRSLYHIDSN